MDSDFGKIRGGVRLWKIFGEPAERPSYSLEPQGELGAVYGGQHCRGPDHDSAYRLILMELLLIWVGWPQAGVSALSPEVLSSH